MELYERALEIMNEKGIRQSEIVSKSGLEDSWVSMFCAGKILNPTIKKLYPFCKAIGATVEELVESSKFGSQ